MNHALAGLDLARKVLQTEAAAILALVDRLDGEFEHAVQLLHGCRGRVIVTGMGKSGIIGRKIAATFSSTGTSPGSSTRRRPFTATSARFATTTSSGAVLQRGDRGTAAAAGGIRRIGARLIALTGNPIDARPGRRRDARLRRRRSLPLNLSRPRARRRRSRSVTRWR